MPLDCFYLRDDILYFWGDIFARCLLLRQVVTKILITILLDCEWWWLRIEELHHAATARIMASKRYDLAQKRATVYFMAPWRRYHASLSYCYAFAWLIIHTAVPVTRDNTITLRSLAMIMILSAEMFLIFERYELLIREYYFSRVYIISFLHSFGLPPLVFNDKLPRRDKPMQWHYQATPSVAFSSHRLRAQDAI